MDGGKGYRPSIYNFILRIPDFTMKSSPIVVRCEHCEKTYGVPFGTRTWVMEFSFCPHCKWPRYPEKYVEYWGKPACQECHVPHALTRSRYKDYCEQCYWQKVYWHKGESSNTSTYLKITIKSYNEDNEQGAAN